MGLLGKLKMGKGSSSDEDEDDLLDWASESEDQAEAPAKKGLLGKLKKGKGQNKAQEDAGPTDLASLTGGMDEDDSIGGIDGLGRGAGTLGEDEEEDSDEEDDGTSEEDGDQGPTNSLEAELASLDDDEEESGLGKPDTSLSADSLLGIFEAEVAVDAQLETLASWVEDVDAEERADDLKELMQFLEAG